MSFRNEIVKTVHKKSESEYTKISEAKILSSSLTGVYKIKLRNGAIATGVTGPSGLQVNDPVVIATYPNQRKKYVIVGKGAKVTGAIKEIRVP